MMFVGDINMVRENRKQVSQRLDFSRLALEGKGLRISRRQSI